MPMYTYAGLWTVIGATNHKSQRSENNFFFVFFLPLFVNFKPISVSNESRFADNKSDTSYSIDFIHFRNLWHFSIDAIIYSTSCFDSLDDILRLCILFRFAFVTATEYILSIDLKFVCISNSSSEEFHWMYILLHRVTDSTGL